MIKPKKIRLETSSACQLKCPSCPTTQKLIHPAIGTGFLKFEDFKKLINENPWIKEIELANYGEIFLNPDILEIMKYAFEHNVNLTANVGANLNNVKEEVLEGLVKYKFLSMHCSLDGASNETYGQYRVRGNFDVVIENIKKINFYKRKYQSDYPFLTWQFLIFGHNEHEIDAAKKMASELNMYFYLKLSWDSEFSPVSNPQKIRKKLGVASREEYRIKHGVDYMQSICHQLWDEPVINWDGKVLGCCRNFWSDFDNNAFSDGLLKSVNNEKINYARKMLLGKIKERSDIPCTTCDIYIDMKKEQKWLKRKLKKILTAFKFTLPPKIEYKIKQLLLFN